MISLTEKGEAFSSKGGKQSQLVVRQDLDICQLQEAMVGCDKSEIKYQRRSCEHSIGWIKIGRELVARQGYFMGIWCLLGSQGGMGDPFRWSTGQANPALLIQGQSFQRANGRNPNLVLLIFENAQGPASQTPGIAQ